MLLIPSASAVSLVTLPGGTDNTTSQSVPYLYIGLSNCRGTR